MGSDYRFARLRRTSLEARRHSGLNGANVIPRTSQVVRCNLSTGNRIERVGGSGEFKGHNTNGDAMKAARIPFRELAAGVRQLRSNFAANRRAGT